MAGCASCLHKNVHPNVCSDCLGGTHFTPRNKSNADYIRAMSDEDMAEWIVLITTAQRKDRSPWLDWLKQDYDIGGGGIRYDEEGNVIDYGITGPPGEPGVKREATE